jgi:hypothetical protein
MGFRHAAVLLLLIVASVFCLAQESFLKSYNIPNQTITRVSTVARMYSDPPFILALEGVNNITNEFFTRLQAFDYNGNLAEGYEDAFVGNPLTVPSGIFSFRSYVPRIMTPVAEYSEDSLRWFMRWQVSTPDSSFSNGFNGIFLPDSIQTVYEFPTAINNFYSETFATDFYQIAGRALVNGVNRCFMITAVEHGQDPDYKTVYFPGLNFISGVAKKGDNYLAIGRSTGWTGKAVLVDADSNVLWQQDFTDACDTSYEPVFTTPLINPSIPGIYGSNIISYQNRDRVMHLANYESQTLTDIFSLQLDSYIGAIPLISDGYSVAFCYVNNGHQYISLVGLDGTLYWTTELPGGGKFGRNSLDYYEAWYERNYLVSAAQPGGGFYLAGVNAFNGKIENDYINVPAVPDVTFYPNPAGEWINLEIDVKLPGRIKISLYNIKGQKVLTLVDENMAPGKFTTRRNLGANRNNVNNSGLYILRSEINGRKFTQKLILHPDNEAAIPVTAKRSH